MKCWTAGNADAAQTEKKSSTYSICISGKYLINFTNVLFDCSEHAIVAARASVMVYDDGNKKWVPSGSSQGISKVQIYHHSVKNTFRVVGRKLNDHEVGNVTKFHNFHNYFDKVHTWTLTWLGFQETRFDFSSQDAHHKSTLQCELDR